MRKLFLKFQSGGGGTQKPKYTGHADAYGLKAIGWTDEDIAYYQENGVNWNEEDDQYHLVSDDNKALYGVLTANNISSYRDRIVYLPKIDTSETTQMVRMFKDCILLVAIPLLDTSNVTDMLEMFNNCYSLYSIPLLDTSNVTRIDNMFKNCRSLVKLPELSFRKVKSLSYAFDGCFSLVYIPYTFEDEISYPGLTSAFSNCYSLIAAPPLNTSNTAAAPDNMFTNNDSLVVIHKLDMQKNSGYSSHNLYTYSLVYANLLNINKSLKIHSNIFSKESLLFIINNEASTNAITITLAKYAYTRLANDVDVVAALTNHPNITLASA